MNDYLSILITMLIGLALTDMLISTHRLLRGRARVKWDWMTPVLAIIMVLQLMGFWWMYFHIYADMRSISVAQFLPDLIMLCLLFLACATVLPDDVPQEGLDLRSYYFASSRYFWTLFWLYCAVGTVALTYRFALPNMTLGQAILGNIPNILLIAGGVLLSRVDRPWLHKAALLVLLPYTLAVQLSLSIGIGS